MKTMLAAVVLCLASSAFAATPSKPIDKMTCEEIKAELAHNTIVAKLRAPQLKAENAKRCIKHATPSAPAGETKKLTPEEQKKLAADQQAAKDKGCADLDAQMAKTPAKSIMYPTFLQQRKARGCAGTPPHAP